ncbi:CaiB/BaiF CoA transferase family protein [Roseovarius sp. 2305UL8-3]|uniref:CaiB/BaiF CoA transferase family protein n=1 Tax=Roseovarius conchicola TaxID=3121636 RepID=UPI003526F468
MLNEFRIIEFEGIGPGPFAAMMLADLGAEVIVIQRPQSANPTVGNHNLLDRGKRAIILDLKDSADLSVAMALIKSSDALIEGNRPGVMERLGLGPRPCLKANPKLVYGRMTGWGQDGPRAAQAGHDYNYIATSGALWYGSQPGQPPQTPATLVGDIGGGALYLVAGILAGLLNAQKTGEGTVVDAAIVDGSAHMMALLMSMAPSGNLAKPRGQSLLDGPHWSRVYQCADGQYLSVQCLETKFYAEFLRILNLSDDPRFAAQYDPAKWTAQTSELKRLFASRPLQHWADLFDGSDACVAPVLAPEDAAGDPHMAERAVWHDRPLQPAPAPRFDGEALKPNPIPERGADGDALRAQLRSKGLL